MKPIKTPTLWEDLQYPAVILGISLLLLLTLKNTFNSVVLLSDQSLVEAENKRQSRWLGFIHSWIDWIDKFQFRENVTNQSPQLAQLQVPLTHTSEAVSISVVQKKIRSQQDQYHQSQSSLAPTVTVSLTAIERAKMPGAPTEYTQVPKNLQASVDELFHPAIAQPFKASELQGEVLIEGGNLSVSLQWEPRDDQAAGGGGVLAVDEIAVERGVMSGDSGLFTYEQEGQSYSGSIFSSGAPGGYILSFENGPYQGVRLQFRASGAPPSDVEIENSLEDSIGKEEDPQDRYIAEQVVDDVADTNADPNIKANIENTTNLAGMAKQLAIDSGGN